MSEARAMLMPSALGGVKAAEEREEVGGATP